MDLMGRTCLPAGGASLDAQDAMTLMNTTKRMFRFVVVMAGLGVSA
jgi:hypothetical protein